MSSRITDPIVEEVRRVRAELSARHGNDVAAIVRYAQELERTLDRPCVRYPPRPLFAQARGRRPKSGATIRRRSRRSCGRPRRLRLRVPRRRSHRSPARPFVRRRPSVWRTRLAPIPDAAPAGRLRAGAGPSSDGVRRADACSPAASRDTSDLLMPTCSAIAGSTGSYLRVDTPCSTNSSILSAKRRLLRNAVYAAISTSPGSPARWRFLRSRGLATRNCRSLNDTRDQGVGGATVEPASVSQARERGDVVEAIERQVRDARTGGFDIDGTVDMEVAMPARALSPVAMKDLDRVISSPDLVPPGTDIQPLGRCENGLLAPGMRERLPRDHRPCLLRATRRERRTVVAGQPALHAAGVHGRGEGRRVPGGDDTERTVGRRTGAAITHTHLRRPQDIRPAIQWKS